MKKSSIIGVLILCFTFWGKAQVRNEIRVPDPEGYRTLKCDFHIHTVFSDGLVWPTVRVDEAYREGLDAIALTEHLEYRPHRQDIIASHNRSYEIAEKTARNNQVILIRGSEITRPMAPGHFNAIFLSDCDALEQKEYMDSFKAARRQNAFIFWNHPGWDRQQPDTTLWWNEHTRLYEEGYMQGIEVANGKKYSPEAQRWCMEKKLTMIGTSDIHQPIQTDIDFARGQHRTMTFVFVRIRKSVGCENTFEKDLTTHTALIIELWHVADELIRRLRKAGFKGHTLTLKIKFHDFTQKTRSISVGHELYTMKEILPLAKQLLAGLQLTHYRIRLMGLTVSNPVSSPDDPEQGIPTQLEINF